jgi:hypothetical protein
MLALFAELKAGTSARPTLAIASNNILVTFTTRNFPSLNIGLDVLEVT